MDVCLGIVCASALSIPQDIPLCSDVTARQVVPLGVGKVLTQCQSGARANALSHSHLLLREMCMSAIRIAIHKHCEAKSRRRISAQCQEPLFLLVFKNYAN